MSVANAPDTGWPRGGVLQTRVSVRFDYPVCFGHDLLAPPDATLARALGARAPGARQRVLFVVDDGLAACRPIEDELLAYANAHRESIDLLGPPLRVPGGEECKNDPAVLERLYVTLSELKLDRHAFVVAVGGGAVLDVVGYAVATAHRGLRHVRMPSTTLSQCDSGIGVKNGVNRFGKKNFLGTFAPPSAVLVDSALLRTLPIREMRAGYAEAVKVAILRDPRFFGWLSESANALRAGDEHAVACLVRRSAELHLDHIATSGDPFESGSSRPLDLGHWAAHKLEALTRHELRHGEAVAIGIALDVTYAELAGVCEQGLAAQVVDLFERLGLPTGHAALADPRLLEGLEEFREHLGGALTIPLPRAIGACVDVGAMSAARIAQASDRLLARRSAPCPS